jgi:hypothetical protein
MTLLVSTGFVSAENAAGSMPALLAAEEPAGRAPLPEAFSHQLYYYFPAGSTLYPADSSVGINYNAGACVNATGASFDFFTIYSHLPQGSRIDYLRIYYYDTSGSNSTASIRKYDGAGNTSDIGTVSSSGNGGFGTQLSPYIGHIVDNSSGSYVVNWQPNVTGGSMQLCGLRVAYRIQVKDVFLPVVQRR